MIKHAFLITAHAHFPLLERIIDLLSAPNHYFFINIDKKSAGGGFFMSTCKKERSNVFFLEGENQMEVAHGGYSQVECCMRLLRLASHHEMEYFHFISGQDFPCHSNEKFDAFFEKNVGRSYMQMDSEAYREECMKEKYPRRIKPYYFKDTPHRGIFFIDFIVRGIDKISSHFLWRKNIPDLWGSWNWFSWHKRVTNYVIEQERTNPQFFKRFHHTNCCDELIFATMLHPLIHKLNIDPTNSLRYINWEKRVNGRRRIGSPLTLNEEEYNEIIESGAFFCRKVHPEISARLLTLLEQNINKES